MKYCKNCLTTDLRPGGEIKDGLCFACLHIESTKSSPTRTKLIELKENSPTPRGRAAGSFFSPKFDIK